VDVGIPFLLPWFAAAPGFRLFEPACDDPRPASSGLRDDLRHLCIDLSVPTISSGVTERELRAEPVKVCLSGARLFREIDRWPDGARFSDGFLRAVLIFPLSFNAWLCLLSFPVNGDGG
jgi:hypothetical protein